ncbi:hypothetical protein I7I48_08108 [Histoplasma ohiense]|nr:hypothetical protein I7I48_08108 [Histoplasma ohiense (nom. inval.)]
MKQLYGRFKLWIAAFASFLPSVLFVYSLSLLCGSEASLIAVRCGEHLFSNLLKSDLWLLLFLFTYLAPRCSRGYGGILSLCAISQRCSRCSSVLRCRPVSSTCQHHVM